MEILKELDKYYFSQEFTRQTIELVLDYMALSRNVFSTCSDPQDLLKTKLKEKDLGSNLGERWLRIKTEAYF